MKREQKAEFIEDVAQRIQDADAIFAIDYRGISVAQVADLRVKLREADATFQIVKNRLTLRALDQVGNENLKEFLEGPTAFTYVKGDVALAAKTINNVTAEFDLLKFKGGQMEGQVVSVEQFKELTKLPSREVLVGRLVGMIAAPLTGLTRGLGSMIGGLAIQLGAIQEQGLIGSAAPEAEEAPAEEPAAEATPAEEPAAEEAPAEEAEVEEAPAEEAEAEEAPAEEASAEEPAADEQPAEEASSEEPAAEEAPAEEPAAEEAPAEEPEAEEASSEEPAAEEAPAEEAAAEETPAEEPTEEEAPAEEPEAESDADAEADSDADAK